MCASLTACTMIRGQLGASINLIVCINFDKYNLSQWLGRSRVLLSRRVVVRSQ